MDQQTNHDVLNVRSEGADPYGFVGLIASLFVIAAGTMVFSALVGGLILLAQVAVLGVEDTRSFYLSLQFDIPTQTKLSAFAVTVVYSGLAGAILVAARYKAREAWRDLVALRPTAGGWRRNASIVVMVLIYAAIASLALAHLRERHVPLEGPTDTLLIGLLTANYALFAPVAEELLFRGWLYTGLRRKLRFGTTFFATALLFAAIHWEPRHMVLVLPLAFALGFVRETTGSIKPTIALHASYNLVIVLITLILQ